MTFMTDCRHLKDIQLSKKFGARSRFTEFYALPYES